MHAAALQPLLQPLHNLWGKGLLGFAADVNADVAGVQADILDILAGHRLDDGFAGFGRNQVVQAAVKIQQRHGDVAQIHAPAHHHFALDQQVLLVAVVDELPEGLSGHIRAVENPFFHAHEVFQKSFVFEMLHQPHVLVQHQAGRIEQEEAEIEQVAGNVAEGFDHLVGIHVPHPGVQQSLVGVEIGRRYRGHQVLDLMGMQRRIHHAEGAAHADAHQVDLIHVGPPADEIHGTIHVAVDMVVDGQVAVLARGIPPIDHVDIHALFEKSAHHGPVGLKVEHGFAVDQGIGDQQRCLDLSRGYRTVVLQTHAVVAVYDIVRGGCHARIQGAQQVLGPFSVFSLRLRALLGHSAEKRHRRISNVKIRFFAAGLMANWVLFTK
jgi:hypothetical protein